MTTTRETWQKIGANVGAVAVGYAVTEFVPGADPRAEGPIIIVAWWMYGWMYSIVAALALGAVGYTGAAVWKIVVWVVRLPRKVLETPRRRIAANAIRVVRASLFLAGVGWITGYSLAGIGYWVGNALLTALPAAVATSFVTLALVVIVNVVTMPFRRSIAPMPEPPRWLPLLGAVLGGWIGWVFITVVATPLDLGDVPSISSGVDGPYWAMVFLCAAIWITWHLTERWRLRIDPSASRIPASPRPVLSPTSLSARVAVKPTPPLPIWSDGEPAPPEPEDEHWSPEPVVAWRSWRYDDGVLTGMYGKPWHGKAYDATCQQGHPAPRWECNCGIYAVMAPPSGGIVGRVELSGTVIEHDQGYRAEKAKITHLWVPDEDTEVLVRKNYRNVAVAIGRPRELQP